jgi:hypothetical protein
VKTGDNTSYANTQIGAAKKPIIYSTFINRKKKDSLAVSETNSELTKQSKKDEIKYIGKQSEKTMTT